MESSTQFSSPLHDNPSLSHDSAEVCHKLRPSLVTPVTGLSPSSAAWDTAEIEYDALDEVQTLDRTGELALAVMKASPLVWSGRVGDLHQTCT